MANDEEGDHEWQLPGEPAGTAPDDYLFVSHGAADLPTATPKAQGHTKYPERKKLSDPGVDKMVENELVR